MMVAKPESRRAHRFALGAITLSLLAVGSLHAAQYQYRTAYVYSEGFPSSLDQADACYATWSGMIVEQGIQYGYFSASIVNYLPGDLWEVSCAYSSEL